MGIKERDEQNLAAERWLGGQDGNNPTVEEEWAAKGAEEEAADTD